MDIEEDDMDLPNLWNCLKIISFWRNGFLKIAFTLIFPLTFCTLVNKEASIFILKDIKFILSFSAIIIWFFKIVYLTFLLVLSLLSTVMFIHRIITIYMNRKFVIAVIPLFLKFRSMFKEFFTFHVYLALCIRCIFLLPSNAFGATVFYVMLIWFIVGYVAGFVVLNVVFLGMNLFLGVLNIFILLIFNRSAMVSWETEAFHMMCYLQLLKLCFFGLLIQTVLFLLYMLSHQEDVSDGRLLHHLMSYLQPLIPISVYFERYLRSVILDLNKLCFFG